MRTHGRIWKKCLLGLSIFVGSATQVGYSQTQSHCTALVNDQCGCAGCTSFRRQKQLLIAPPPCDPNCPVPSIVEAPLKPQPSTEQPVPGADAATAPPVEFPPPPSFADQVPFGQAPQDQSPLDDIPMANQPAARPSASQFAGVFGDSASNAGVPAMLGDFCGLGASPTPNGSPGFPGRVITTPVAGGDCRHKLAEFTNPCPRDRVFFTYHHYNNGLRDIDGRIGSADLFTLGMEKTVWDGLASFEIRVPFLGGGVSSTQTFGDTFGAEFGNVATTFKLLLINNRRFAMSTGTTTIWPTGDDGIIPSVLTIENDSLHCMPFAAMLFKPNDLWFHQLFVQLDFDLSGDTVRDGRGQRIDVIQDQSLIYLDYSIGRWLYQGNRGLVRRVAGITELHYTGTLNDADVGNSFRFADINRNVLNLTAGIHCVLGNSTVFRIGGGAPLRTGADRPFDSEITAQLARFF